MAIIEISNLQRRFGDVVAVRDVSLQAPKGSVYAFLGPNGSGKTTTIRLMLGLLRPDSGTVRLFGKSLQQERREVLRKVGSMVEMPSLYPHLTGVENLKTKSLMIGVPASEITRVLDVVGLRKDGHRLVRGYSLGMRQRLGLALALLGSPELLILDEPTNGLDPAGIDEMRQLVRQLSEAEGLTIFLSSHLLTEVEQVASHVAILSAGTVLFDGTIEGLHTRQRVELLVGVSRMEEAASFLKRSGIESSRRNGYLSLIESELISAAKINALLVEAGFEVDHLAKQRPSLEQIFLSMTSEAE